jgi:hypothetical protein
LSIPVTENNELLETIGDNGGRSVGDDGRSNEFRGESEKATNDETGSVAAVTNSHGVLLTRFDDDFRRLAAAVIAEELSFVVPSTFVVDVDGIDCDSCAGVN